MNRSFITYPELTARLLMQVGYVSEKPVFSYTENRQIFPLEIDREEGSEGNIRGLLMDPACTWYPDTHNLSVHITFRMTSAYYLFGKGGIAAPSATVGVAVRWFSTKSDERGIIPFGEINRLDSVKEFNFDTTFDRGKLRGSLKLQTVLYLKSPGSPEKNELYFAQIPGTILGIISQSEIYIDGNGSVFPVATVEKPGKPLWEVYFNDACDPFTDRFDEDNVEIRLNQSHPAFEMLKADGSMSDSPLFLEVLSSALVLIVESTKEAAGEEWETLLRGENCSEGSIASAVSHFITDLGWDVSSPSALSQSVKEFLEKK